MVIVPSIDALEIRNVSLDFAHGMAKARLKEQKGPILLFGWMVGIVQVLMEQKDESQSG